MDNPPQRLDKSNDGATTAAPTAWATVLGRKAKRADKAKTPGSYNETTPQQDLPQQQREIQDKRKRQRAGQQIRAPRRAVITMTVAPGSQKTYADIMAAAKSKISLQEVGISDLSAQRSITGGLILEIPGKDTSEKADNLAERLRQLFKDEGEIRISRPMNKAEIRISGMDDSITPQEVVDAIADLGSCSKDNIKVGAIRRRWNSGMGSVWAQCPVTAVKKLAAVGRIKIGWVSAKVEIPRPLQCFRCLETGHVKQQCTSEKDRTGQCISCGETGHAAKVCPGTPKCPLCSDRKLEANHRLGRRAAPLQ